MSNVIINDGAFNIRKRGWEKVKSNFGQLYFGLALAILMLELPMVLFNHFFPGETYAEMLNLYNESQIDILELFESSNGIISIIYQCLVQGPIMYGAFKLVWSAYNNENSGALTVLEGFARPVRAFAINTYVGIIVTVFTILVLIPFMLFGMLIGGFYYMTYLPILVIVGVVAVVVFSLKYQLVYLVAIEDEKLGILEVAKVSSKIVKGNKASLFKLMATFIFDLILASIAFAVLGALISISEFIPVVGQFVLLIISAALVFPVVGVRYLAAFCEFFAMLTRKEEDFEEPKLS